MADLAPTAMVASPLKIRIHWSKRSPADKALWRTATHAPNRVRKRRSIWDMRAISGTRTKTELPRFKTVSANRFGDSVHVAVSEGTGENDIRNFLESKGHENVEVNKIQPDIEDCFMDLMTQADE